MKTLATNETPLEANVYINLPSKHLENLPFCAGEIALWSKHFLCKHEDLSSVLRDHSKKPGSVQCTWDPSTGQAETSGFLGLSGLAT